MDGNIRQVVLKANVLARLGRLSMDSGSDDGVHGKENENRTSRSAGPLAGQSFATAAMHYQNTGEEVILKIPR